jgi:hypothetical protein
LKPPKAAKNRRKSKGKNAGQAGVFFALSGPFWYGFSLESWGRFFALRGHSKTQEMGDFGPDLDGMKSGFWQSESNG